MSVIMRNSLVGCDTVLSGRDLLMLWETANFYQTTWHHVPENNTFLLKVLPQCNDRWKAALYKLWRLQQIRIFKLCHIISKTSQKI